MLHTSSSWLNVDYNQNEYLLAMILKSRMLKKALSIIILISTISLVSINSIDNFAFAADFTLPNQSLDDERFGQSVVIDGNNILIGVPRHDTATNTNVGIAYLFDATTGNLLQTFENPVPSSNDHFGHSVAIDGNNILISSPQGNFDTSFGIGTVYLFDAASTTPLYAYENPEPTTIDGFGASVDLDGNNILIGAAGKAYLFDIGNPLVPMNTFSSPTGSSSFSLWWDTVAIDGNNIVIADRNADNGYGEVYHYYVSTGTLHQTIQNPVRLPLTTPPWFGIGLSIDENRVLIGAHRDSNGETLQSEIRTGAAHLFDLATGNKITTYRHPTLAGNANVGISVSLDGDVALIGYCSCIGSSAPGQSGVLLFGTNPTGELLQTIQSNEKGLGFSVFINGENSVIGSPLLGTGSAFVSTNIDGIESSIDTLPNNFSNDFNDISIGGTTSGTILVRGDQMLSVTEISNPDGVKISADILGGSIPAQVTACNNTMNAILNAGDEIIVTCSSVTVQVINGLVEIEFDLGDGTTATTTLNTGETLTFDQNALEITADPGNPGGVTVIVDSQPIIIAPGQTVNLSGSPVFSPAINLSNNPTFSHFSFGPPGNRIAAEENNVYVVWEDGSPSDSFLKISNDNGVTFGAPINLSNNAGTSFHTTVVVDGNNIYTAWRDSVLGNDEIFFSKSIDGGATFSTPVNLSNDGGFQDFPQIAISGNHVYVSWFGNPGSDIHIAVSIDGGNTFGTSTNISQNGGSSFNHRMTASGSDVYLTWRDTSFGAHEILFSVSHDNGATFSTPVNLSSDPTNSVEPFVVTSGNNVYVAWSDDGSPKKALLKISNDNGNTFGSTINLGNGYPFAAGTVIDTSGSDVYVVWHGIDIGETQCCEIFVSVSNDGGITFGTPMRLTNLAGESTQPFVVSDGNTVWIAWRDNGVGNFDIFASASNDNGATFSTPVNLSGNPGTSGQLHAIAAASNNHDYIIWEDDTPGNRDIFFTVGRVPLAVPQDTTPPVFSGVPADIIVEASSPAGATATFTQPTATDDVDGAVAVTCDAESDVTIFSYDPVLPNPDPTTVICTATDSAGNTTQVTFTVTVQDTTPPTLSAQQPDIEQDATSASGAIVTFTTPTATDAVDLSPSVNCIPASGSQFALGNTLVTCTATDDTGNSNQTAFTVTIVPVADLSISIAESADPVDAGTPLDYTITILNSGPNDAQNVLVSNVLPVGVTLQSVASSQNGCISLPCNLGTITSNSSATVTISVAVSAVATGPLTSIASVISDTNDPNPIDNTINENTGVIATNANISASATVGTGTTVGAKSNIKENVVVGNDVTIGASVKISNLSQIGDGTIIGDSSKIKESVVIGNDVTIGNGVKISNSSQIGDGTIIGDSSKIKESVVIGNGVVIGNNVTIGNGATILDGAVVPSGTTIPAGSIFS